MVDISDAILPLAEALERAGVPYAFGGAIAHGYHAQPRATTDIDVNIFLRETESEPVLTALAALGVLVDMERDAARIRRDGQIRLRWDRMAVDLFSANFEFLDTCRDRLWRVPFEGREIPILFPCSPCPHPLVASRRPHQGFGRDGTRWTGC